MDVSVHQETTNAQTDDDFHRQLQEKALAEQMRLAVLGRDLGLALGRNGSLAEMLHECAEVIWRNMDAAFARIWIVNEAKDVLVLRASVGMYTHLDGPHSRIPVGQFKIGRIAASRQPHLCNAVRDDPEVDDPQWAEAEGMAAFAGYPLLVDEQLVGVMAMFARQPLSEAALEALASVANGIAVGVDRKISDQRLHEQREWLQVTLASIGDAVIATDTAGRVTFLNPSAQQLTGWAQEEAVGQAIDEVFPIIDEQSREKVESPTGRVLRDGERVATANHRLLVAKDGRERPIDDSAAPIRNPSGKIIGVVLVFRDLEERRLGEQAARASERAHIENLRSVRQAVTNALAEAPTIEEAITAVLHAVCDGLHWDIGFFWIRDRPHNHLQCQQSWHRTGLPLVEFESYSRERTFGFNQGLPGRAWAAGGPTWVNEVTQEADFPRARWAAREGLHSAFAVPIVVSHQCLGVFEFFNQRICKPDDNLLEMMATVAGQVGQFLERKRAEEGLREQTLVAETLNRVGRLLAAELDLASIVQIVIEEGLQLTGGEGGVFFYEVESEWEEPSLHAAHSGPAAEDLARFLAARRNAELVHSTLRGDAIVRLEDAAKRIAETGQESATEASEPTPAGPSAAESSQSSPVRSYLAVPVISHRSAAVGSLFLCHRRPGVFDERHERMLSGIATQAATAIDNARLYKRTQESEQRFRQLAEQIDDVFWMLDPHTPQMLYISPAYEQISGLSRERLYADPRSFLEAVHPDDHQRVLDAQKTYILGAPSSVEYRVIRPDGTMRWMWDRAFPIQDKAGNVYRVAGIAEDVTERKQAEDATRFLADASTSLAAIVDYKSTLQRVAGLSVPAFADWCAVDLAEADGTLRRLAVVHADPAKVQLAQELSRRYPLNPEAPRGAYHVLRTGEPELIQDVADPRWTELANNDPHLRLLRRLGLGSFMCVPLQIRNVTTGVLTFAYAESGRRYEPHDLALAEELARRAAVAIENARLYAALREADRRKDEFLAMLAHELRNPLAPIRSGLDILALNEDPQSETVHLMQEQVGHLVRLVDDLLDVSRIVRGRIELRRELVELSTIVKRSVDAMRPILASRNQTLVTKLHVEPLWLDADPVRLIQVVENLLNNASKYMDHGGRIQLNTERRGSQAVIRVQDEGIGIEADLLPKIFDLFTQSARSLDRSQGGLGIGLTLVRNLVEMHQGDVSVASAGPGQGSQFEVTLPTITAIDQREDIAKAPPAMRGRRILVVDDNVGAAKMLAVLLKRLGPHEIAMAHDGPTTIEVAERFEPELILLDIGLPRMDGLAVAWNLRQRPKFHNTLIVALTGYGQEEDRRRSKEAGFDEHLVKPVGVQTLKALLCHPKLASPE